MPCNIVSGCCNAFICCLAYQLLSVKRCQPACGYALSLCNKSFINAKEVIAVVSSKLCQLEYMVCSHRCHLQVQVLQNQGCCVLFAVSETATMRTSGYNAISMSPKFVWNTIRSSPSLGPAIAAIASQQKRSLHTVTNSTNKLSEVVHMWLSIRQAKGRR